MMPGGCARGGVVCGCAAIWFGGDAERVAVVVGEFGDGGGEIEQGVTIVVYDRGFVFTHFCVFVWRMTIWFRFLC